jgi:hypothetical protein
MKISQDAFKTLHEILKNLQIASTNGAKVQNLLVLQNPIIANTVFIKYDIEFMSAGEKKFEPRLTQVDDMGQPMDINDQFDNVYQRYAFLGDCIPVNVSDLKIR